MGFLYKYKPINKQTLQTLLNRQIYFPQSNQFNDPFDAKLLPSDFASEMKEMGLCHDPGQIAQHEKYVKDRIMGYGIFCTSRKCNDILMWSHYADSHRGICIGFNKNIIKNIDRDWPIMEVPVMYCSDHPFTSVYKDMMTGSAFSSPDHFTNHFGFGNALLKAALSVKHESWKYEDEVRIVSEESGPHAFEAEAIDHIIFGIDTPKSDRESIKIILDSTTWRHVRVFSSQRSKAALSLDIVDEEGKIHGGTVPTR